MFTSLDGLALEKKERCITAYEVKIYNTYEWSREDEGNCSSTGTGGESG